MNLHGFAFILFALANQAICSPLSTTSLAGLGSLGGLGGGLGGITGVPGISFSGVGQSSNGVMNNLGLDGLVPVFGATGLAGPLSLVDAIVDALGIEPILELLLTLLQPVFLALVPVGNVLDLLVASLTQLISLLSIFSTLSPSALGAFG